MEKLLPRQEMDPTYTWDLSALYPSHEAAEEHLQDLSEFAFLAEYEGQLLASGEKLYEALTKIYSYQRELSRLLVYASQKEDEDTADNKRQDFALRAQNLYLQVAASLSYLAPELVQLGQEQYEEFLAAEPRLAEYEQVLAKIRRQAPYVLSAKEEEILAHATKLARVPGTVYNTLTTADFIFADFVDGKGATRELNEANFIYYQGVADRVARKNSYESYYATYEAHEHSLASLYYNNLQQDLFFAQLRGYESTRQMSLYENEIPEAVYEQLLKVIRSRLPDFYRYVALRKKLLGVDELYFYDVYAPLVPETELKFTVEEAQDLILAALKPLGADYLAIVEQAFSERWIDYYPNLNKASGAYSHGHYDSPAYILMNFNGTLDAVFTLAHELGHSVHSTFADQAQSYQNSGYSLFVAEVASTCNEALLTEYLLEKYQEEQEILQALLVNQLESFKGTVFRQTMFADFEYSTHQQVAQGASLTASSLKEQYQEFLELYFGPEIILDEQIALEWARIPHFYRPFYVYQYATGYAAAIALSKRILSGGEKERSAYLQFLSLGNSASPLDSLKIAGVDMSKAEPIEAALDVFNESLERLSSLT